MNNIQINGKKFKLIIMNSSEKEENRSIKLGGKCIQEEDTNKIT